MTQSLAEMLSAVDIVDLTQPLSEDTPVLKLPPPFANTPGLTRHEISRYDDRGPAWAWDWLEIGECGAEALEFLVDHSPVAQLRSDVERGCDIVDHERSERHAG